MKTRSLLTTLLVGLLLAMSASTGLAQELYYGDEDDMSPEEYYLEGIGYGVEDYASYSAEDTSYSGLYTPTTDDAIYAGTGGEYEPVVVDEGAYALPADPGPGASGTGAGVVDAADWFSMAGVALLEVVGDDDTGRVLIVKDASGKFRTLETDETMPGAFKVLDIGSEQARVEPTDGGAAKVVPVLHRPAPLDAFLAAVTRLQNLRLAIGTTLDREVPFDSTMQNLEEGFAPFLAQENAYMHRIDDVVVVRSAPFLDGAGAYDPEPGLPEGEGVDLAAFRATGAEILEEVIGALPNGTEGGPSDVPATVTLRMGTTPAAEALHYLNLAWTTDYRARAPEPEAEAPTRTASSRDKAERLYRQAVAYGRKGNYKEAGRRLLYLCKHGSKDARHYQALGKVYWKLGRARHAVRAWRAGLKVDPTNATTRKLLTKARQQIRKLRAGA